MMPDIDLSQHAKLTYADGAGSFTEHYPTLAEAVDVYRSLDRHLQMTAVIETSSRRFEAEDIAAIRTAGDGAGPLSTGGTTLRPGDAER